MLTLLLLMRQYNYIISIYVCSIEKPTFSIHTLLYFVTIDDANDTVITKKTVTAIAMESSHISIRACAI